MKSPGMKFPVKITGIPGIFWNFRKIFGASGTLIHYFCFAQTQHVRRDSPRIRFRSTKNQKNLNVGTLFKKALDEIQGQTLQILGFFKHR